MKELLDGMLSFPPSFYPPGYDGELDDYNHVDDDEIEEEIINEDEEFDNFGESYE